MNIKPRSIFKGVAKFVGSMGVGALVTLGLKQNVIPGNKYEKIMCAIGTFVISDMISTAAEEYLEKQCDSIFDASDSIKNVLFGSEEQPESENLNNTELTEEAINKIWNHYVYNDGEEKENKWQNEK